MRILHIKRFNFESLEKQRSRACDIEENRAFERIHILHDVYVRSF